MVACCHCSMVQEMMPRAVGGSTSLIADSTPRSNACKALFGLVLKHIFGRSFDKKNPDSVEVVRQQVVNDMKQIRGIKQVLPLDVGKVVDQLLLVVLLAESDDVPMTLLKEVVKPCQLVILLI